MVPDGIVVDPERLVAAAVPARAAAELVAAVVPRVEGALRGAAAAAAPLRSGPALAALSAVLRPDLVLLAMRLHGLARALRVAASVYGAAERATGAGADPAGGRP